MRKTTLSLRDQKKKKMKKLVNSKHASIATEETSTKRTTSAHPVTLRLIRLIRTSLLAKIAIASLSAANMENV